MPGARLFHVSPQGCGEQDLARLFAANGHPVACHEGGGLAADILYAQGRGGPLLQPWPKARLLAGLWRHGPHWRPPLDAWRSFAFLADRFPKARFLLTLRAEDDLIAARLAADGGRVLRAHAYHHGLDADGVAVLWRREWQDHLAAVRAHFAGSDRLIELDLDRDSPSDLAARLAGFIDLPVLPISRWSDASPAPAPLPRPDPAPAAWPEDVALFCLQGLAPMREGGMEGLSPLACHWDGRVGAGLVPVIDRAGAPRQFAVFRPDGAGPLALARDGRHFKLIRAEGVINDILRLGRRDPVWIDMEDSRWMGSPQGAPVSEPVLCHNRRAGAVNAVLWPLPDQHATGLPGFDAASPPDDIPWSQKHDRLVWRGMISGSEMREGVKPGPASHVWLSRLAEARDADTRAEAWEGLCRTNRMAFIRRWIDHPDFDIGIVMAPAFRAFADDPLLAPFCRPRMGPGDFRRFRYQLCMTGYDHGSNFISGLDQNGVLFAEDDGWQVFYSGRFLPWQHYIPVARYLTDLPEKLDWARANQAECQAISARARAEVRHLRDPAARRALMRLILDGLAAAR
ncbi:hypothetical protein KY389_04275 [Paracoccus bogoriensis]|uniref:glycosyl transferase family 90 n=1 Tax=Paracoccus bogoriensis TaxID=242065 RepID=UPI001CA59F63|nr:glycosyl transferase family 90 [Paracoccus bogoriensis]MBW7055913.1 hypothetical protein [Paracoccus bogoriensis]